MLKSGDQAPAFRSQTHSGQTVSSQDFLGKKIVLWFYPKASTPGCTAEGCLFRDLQAEFAKKNAIILGVSFDDQAANAAFAKTHHFTFPLLCDTERHMGLAYGACDDIKATHAKRIGIVIDEHGKILSYHAQVNASTWPDEVLKNL